MSGGTENKSTGSFYTPEWCADLLCEMSGLYDLHGDEAMRTVVIDPSCGDGAILVRAAAHIITCGHDAGISAEKITEAVRRNIVGFEIDAEEAEKCRVNLAASVEQLDIHISPDDFSIFTGDAFSLFREWSGKADFVIGNPPYVRIHNMDERPDSTYITGMCDLYYGFYDIGQQMLSYEGILCYISPSSWMTSKAGYAMRDDLKKRRAISKILDFGHEQVFDNATTYTAITVIDKRKHDSVDVAVRETIGEPVVWDSRQVEDLWISGLFVPRSTTTVREILEFLSANINDDGVRDAIEQVKVRNGYATMRDKTFISKKLRCESRIKKDRMENEDGTGNTEDAIEIKVVKASRGDEMYAIYPYDRDGQLLTFDEIQQSSIVAADILLSDREALLRRNKVPESKWQGYGRSQGIADTWQDKIAVQSIVRPDHPVRITCAPAGVGVFGGIYIIGLSKKQVRKYMSDDIFWDWCRALAKYKSGGYYTFSSKELEQYLRWRVFSDIVSTDKN